MNQMLGIQFLIPLHILNLACTSGHSVHVLMKPRWKIFNITLLACEISAVVWQFEHSLALPFFGIEMKTDLFQSYGHCWVFQICWHIDCSTLTASSFRIWNMHEALHYVRYCHKHFCFVQEIHVLFWYTTLYFISKSDLIIYTIRYTTFGKFSTILRSYFHQLHIMICIVAVIYHFSLTVFLILSGR